MANNQGAGGQGTGDEAAGEWDEAVVGCIGECRGRLVGIATGVVNDADWAEDIVQKASVRALKAARANPAKAKKARQDPCNWLAGFVRNVALEELKKRALRARLREENQIAICEHLFSEEDLWQVDWLVERILDAAPLELTERERRVIALLLGGMSNAEVAIELESSPVTVRVHRANALRKLKAAYLEGRIEI